MEMEVLVFVFVLIVFILLLTGSYIKRSIKKARKAVRDAADMKEQRQRNEIGRQRQQYSMKPQPKKEAEEQEEVREEPVAEQKTEENEVPQPDEQPTVQEEKRIFDDDEGDYVEFEEVK